MKKFIRITVCLACSFAVLLHSASCTSKANVYGENIKNVILVIGDGMGNNHIENACTYFELERPTFMQDKVCGVCTSSASSLVTDSAAAATAMATGQKVNNRAIAYDVNGNPLTSISTLAKNAGKKVGIVTTDTLDGATPAGFSSHAPTRGESEMIARGQADSNIDLFIGQSSLAYTTTYAPFFTQTGYTTFSYLPDIQTIEKNKTIALLDGVHSCYNEAFTEHYQLKDMASFAIDFLENDEGYFLMIESAYIDKFSHDQDLIPTLCEVRSLFDTIGFLYESVGEDTAILITADHETGLLKKANSKAQISNYLYGSGGHSFSAVPFFLKNATIQTDTSFIENTEIFEICKTLLNV